MQVINIENMRKFVDRESILTQKIEVSDWRFGYRVFIVMYSISIRMRIGYPNPVDWNSESTCDRIYPHHNRHEKLKKI